MSQVKELIVAPSLVDECKALRSRLARTEWHVRCLGTLLVVAIVLPFAAGAFDTNGDIVVKDPANGRVRVALHGGPGPAFIEIYHADGTRRLLLGESDAGVPHVLFYNQDGQSVARALAP